MKIIRTDRELQTPVVDAGLSEAGHELVLLPGDISEAELIEQSADADLILMCYSPITRAVIENATGLKGIVKYGVGIDAIDIPAAIARGIPVVNIPEYAEETVAEGAFALLLALCRKLPALDRRMKSAGWAWPEPDWLGLDIADKTVGLVGFGKIGRSFARMAGQGFRARVIAFDPNVVAKEMSAHGVEKIEELPELLRQCDILSLHTVLNDHTRQIIGRPELAQMKQGAILINVSRGALIDEEALCDALKSGHLGGAGLDVFSREPLNCETHPMRALFGMDNVILSPHLTFYSREAMDRLERETLERCREIIDGRAVTIKSRDPRLRRQKGAFNFIP